MFVLMSVLLAFMTDSLLLFFIDFSISLFGCRLLASPFHLITLTAHMQGKTTLSAEEFRATMKQLRKHKDGDWLNLPSNLD